MKTKRTLSMVLMAAAIMVLAACGKSLNLSPEEEKIVKEARKGFLGEAGEEFALYRIGIKHLYEQKMGMEKRADQDYVNSQTDIDKRIHEMESEWKGKAEAFLEKVKDFEIETEVAPDVPLKVVSPFKVARVKDYISTKATLELTIDRPAIKDKKNHPDKYYSITYVLYDANDNPISEPISSWEEYHEIKAGEQCELTLSIFTNARDCSNLKYLAVKKIRVFWEHPMQERKADMVFGELGLFELRGPVKNCTWKSIYNTIDKLVFDADGMWTRSNGRNPWANQPNVKRDAQGRIVKMDNGDEYTEYTYDEQGRVIRRIVAYMDGRDDTKWEYDGNGDCVKNVNSYEGMDAEEGDDNRVSTYTIVERDDHGNWTKRKDQNGQVETRTITYYE